MNNNKSVVATKRSRVPQRKAIVVLGMHRSGTSALTRVLSLLGATLPHHLLEANPTNPAGHWEPELLVSLHDEMLTEAGSRWDDWRAFDPDALPAERLRHYKGEIKRIIVEEYADDPLIVIKDPRICRFVPLYEAILEEMGIVAHYVIAQRNPLAVIESLGNRDNMTPGFAGLLWLRHMLDACFTTQARPRVFISYEELLNDWREVERRIAEALTVTWPRSVDDAAVEVDSHLDRDLQHFAPTRADLKTSTLAAQWVKEGYSAYLKLLDRENDKDALASLDNIKDEFGSLCEIFGEATFPELRSREQRLHAELGATRKQSNLDKKEIIKMSEELAAQKGRIVDLEGQRIETARAVEAFAGEMAQMREHFTQQERRLQGEIRQLEQTAELLQNEVAAARVETDGNKIALVQTQMLSTSLQSELETERQAVCATRDQLHQRHLEVVQLCAEINEQAAALTTFAAQSTSYQEITKALQRDRDDARAEERRLYEVLNAVYRSTSWKISSPLRVVKLGGIAVAKTPQAAGAWFVRSAYGIWHRLPLPVHRKATLKSAIFTRFAGIFKYTNAYQAWRSQAPDDHHGRQHEYLRIATGSSLHKNRQENTNIYADYVANIFRLPQTQKTEISLDYVPKSVEHFSLSDSEVTVIAFYLPQFHPFPENDAWWGKGFTEWTNVTKAVPQFLEHYQPHLPGELGFYDLRLVDVMRQQADLARLYGVSGFCFHHYWFGGKRLMERPVNQFLGATDIDMPFCLCWANENWTRRWDGAEHDVLMAQNHSPEDDIAFIEDLFPAFSDSRYIRFQGRPVLIVYRATLLPDPAATAARWRARAREAGIGDLYLVAARSFDIKDPRPLGFDAAIEFPPHQIPASRINDRMTIVNPDYIGNIYSYEELGEGYAKQRADGYPLIKTVMPGWDNEPRKPGAGHTFHGAFPATYAKWLRLSYAATVEARRESANQPPFLFVNAWNEWAEGAHLEPDRKFGYGYLHATANVIREFLPPHREVAHMVQQSQENFSKQSRYAIVLHLHYDDLFGALSRYIGSAPDADVFISIRSDIDPETCKRIVSEHPQARLAIYPNRGRDIQPFLQTLRLIKELGYELACKIHSKKSPQRLDGEMLRTHALEALLGSASTVQAIVERFDKRAELGLLAPEGSTLRLDEPDRNVLNRKWLDHLLPRIDAPELVGNYMCRFVAGSMFWFRVDAFASIDDLNLNPEDFEDESGQVDGTLAHAVERLMALGAERRGYETEEI